VNPTHRQRPRIAIVLTGHILWRTRYDTLLSRVLSLFALIEVQKQSSLAPSLTTRPFYKQKRVCNNVENVKGDQGLQISRPLCLRLSLACARALSENSCTSSSAGLEKPLPKSDAPPSPSRALGVTEFVSLRCCLISPTGC
jgi:hypothetical protein